MIELLVTIVLAGIIIPAMVGLFANALARTAGDEFRVTANNLAQDRIEKVRTLAYSDITQANMNLSPFTTTFTPAGGGRPYAVVTSVDSTHTGYKLVTVAISWSESGRTYTRSVQTEVMDPSAITSTSTTGPQTGNGPFSLTVAFKNWTEVTSAGVVVVYVDTSPTPNVTVTATPTKLVPNASSTTVTWTGLPGGPNKLYTVTCHSTYITSTSPAFHLLSNGWLKFDTNPGGS
jgi:Tfp pilus assembly protein PilV